jgi:hypothetical protein
MNSGDTTPTVSLGDWLARLRAELGDDAARELTARESAALFDLARVVAHTSERIATPLTTFLAGLVLGELGAEERAEYATSEAVGAGSAEMAASAAGATPCGAAAGDASGIQVCGPQAIQAK